jgi:hypothetical protein
MFALGNVQFYNRDVSRYETPIDISDVHIHIELFYRFRSFKIAHVPN